MENNLIVNYINQLNQNNSQLHQYCLDIMNFKNKFFIPAVRYDTALFLRFIAGLKQPRKILEIGFGSGLSALFINDLIQPDQFISLERDVNRYERGQLLFEKFKINNICLKHTDAFQFFKQDQTQYELIFLDAVKRDYIDYIAPLKERLAVNGILICDNILFNGKVTEQDLASRYVQGVQRLKQFNLQLSSDKELETAFLNIGDGLSLSSFKQILD